VALIGRAPGTGLSSVDRMGASASERVGRPALGPGKSKDLRLPFARLTYHELRVPHFSTFAAANIARRKTLFVSRDGIEGKQAWRLGKNSEQWTVNSGQPVASSPRTLLVERAWFECD
jgi:hypothetical protein